MYFLTYRSFTIKYFNVSPNAYVIYGDKQFMFKSIRAAKLFITMQLRIAYGYQMSEQNMRIYGFK